MHANPPSPAPFRLLVAALLCTAVAGCGHLPQLSLPHVKWPFSRKVAPPPQPVEELVIESAPGAAQGGGFLQFWERNTLVVDMRSAGGSGTVTLRPRPHTEWPVRLLFRVTPGSIGQLAVQGDERTTFPVAASGVAPIDLRPAPSTYTVRTPTITLTWGPAPALPAN